MSKHTPFLCLFLYAICAFADIHKYNSNNNCDHGSNGMGTVLFTAADVHKQCWSPDEIAILTTRMILEDLLPDITILNIDSNAYIDDTVNYFRLLIEVVKTATHGRKRHITLQALTDLLGGYLQYAVLPIARHAYYAGLIDYTSMEKLIQLFEELKWFLRTNGQGWSKPIESKPVFEIQPINFDSEAPKNVKSCCSRLIYYETEQHTKENNCTVVRNDVFFPSPFFDSKVRPSAIAVPFRRYALRNIESRKAAYLLQKFFISAVQCMKEKRSSKETIIKFQNNFFSWIEKEVLTKLHDDKFYSAFGGILRIEETLKNLGAVTNSETTCGPEGEEEVGAIPEKGTTKNSKSSIILLVMLISIIFWFILGTAFICYRMRKNQRQNKEEPQQPDYNTSSSVSSKWSLFSKSSKSEDRRNGSSTATPKTTPYTSSFSSIGDVDDKKQSGEQKKLKKICYPPVPITRTRSHDKPAVIETKTTMKKLPSITEVSEYSTNKPEDQFTYQKFGEPMHTSSKDDLRKVSFKRRPSVEYNQIPCPKIVDRSTSSSKTQPDGKDTPIDECWCHLYEDDEENEGRGKRRPKRRSKEDKSQLELEQREMGKRTSFEEQQKVHTFEEQPKRGSFEERARGSLEERPRGSFEGTTKRGSFELRRKHSLETNSTLKEEVSTDKGSERDISDTMESTQADNMAELESDETMIPKNGNRDRTNGKKNVRMSPSDEAAMPVSVPKEEHTSTSDNSVVETSAAENSGGEVSLKENSKEDVKKSGPNTDSHIYACHSSLTGAYANQKRASDNRYIFGYDFQTSTSSDFSDEETDLRTSTSK